MTKEELREQVERQGAINYRLQEDVKELKEQIRECTFYLFEHMKAFEKLTGLVKTLETEKKGE